jgi:hypothetical protein
MAMNINLTLLVQVVNFIIAYLLITRLFLKPGYKALKVDEDRLRQLHDAVNDEQQVLAQKEFYKKERWRVCQNYFVAHRPSAFDVPGGVQSTEAVEPLQGLSPQELSSIAADISKQVAERIRHD